MCSPAPSSWLLPVRGALMAARVFTCVCLLTSICAVASPEPQSNCPILPALGDEIAFASGGAYTDCNFSILDIGDVMFRVRLPIAPPLLEASVYVSTVISDSRFVNAVIIAHAAGPSHSSGGSDMNNTDHQPLVFTNYTFLRCSFLRSYIHIGSGSDVLSEGGLFITILNSTFAQPVPMYGVGPSYGGGVLISTGFLLVNVTQPRVEINVMGCAINATYSVSEVENTLSFVEVLAPPSFSFPWRIVNNSFLFSVPMVGVTVPNPALLLLPKSSMFNLVCPKSGVVGGSLVIDRNAVETRGQITDFTLLRPRGEPAVLGYLVLSGPCGAVLSVSGNTIRLLSNVPSSSWGAALMRWFVPAGGPTSGTAATPPLVLDASHNKYFLFNNNTIISVPTSKAGLISWGSTVGHAGGIFSLSGNVVTGFKKILEGSLNGSESALLLCRNMFNGKYYADGDGFSSITSGNLGNVKSCNTSLFGIMVARTTQAAAPFPPVASTTMPSPLLVTSVTKTTATTTATQSQSDTQETSSPSAEQSNEYTSTTDASAFVSSTTTTSAATATDPPTPLQTDIQSTNTPSTTISSTTSENISASSTSPSPTTEESSTTTTTTTGTSSTMPTTDQTTSTFPETTTSSPPSTTTPTSTTEMVSTCDGDAMCTSIPQTEAKEATVTPVTLYSPSLSLVKPTATTTATRPISRSKVVGTESRSKSTSKPPPTTTTSTIATSVSVSVLFPLMLSDPPSSPAPTSPFMYTRPAVAEGAIGGVVSGAGVATGAVTVGSGPIAGFESLLAVQLLSVFASMPCSVPGVGGGSMSMFLTPLDVDTMQRYGKLVGQLIVVCGAYGLYGLVYCLVWAILRSAERASDVLRHPRAIPLIHQLTISGFAVECCKLLYGNEEPTVSERLVGACGLFIVIVSVAAYPAITNIGFCSLGGKGVRGGAERIEGAENAEGRDQKGKHNSMPIAASSLRAETRGVTTSTSTPPAPTPSTLPEFPRSSLGSVGGKEEDEDYPTEGSRAKPIFSESDAQSGKCEGFNQTPSGACTSTQKRKSNRPGQRCRRHTAAPYIVVVSEGHSVMSPPSPVLRRRDGDEALFSQQSFVHVGIGTAGEKEKRAEDTKKEGEGVDVEMRSLGANGYCTHVQNTCGTDDSPTKRGLLAEVEEFVTAKDSSDAVAKSYPRLRALLCAVVTPSRLVDSFGEYTAEDLSRVPMPTILCPLLAPKTYWHRSIARTVRCVHSGLTPQTSRYAVASHLYRSLSMCIVCSVPPHGGGEASCQAILCIASAICFLHALFLIVVRSYRIPLENYAQALQSVAIGAVGLSSAVDPSDAQLTAAFSMLLMAACVLNAIGTIGGFLIEWRVLSPSRAAASIMLEQMHDEMVEGNNNHYSRRSDGGGGDGDDENNNTTTYFNNNEDNDGDPCLGTTSTTTRDSALCLGVESGRVEDRKDINDSRTFWPTSSFSLSRSNSKQCRREEGNDRLSLLDAGHARWDTTNNDDNEYVYTYAHRPCPRPRRAATNTNISNGSFNVSSTHEETNVSCLVSPSNPSLPLSPRLVPYFVCSEPTVAEKSPWPLPHSHSHQ